MTDAVLMNVDRFRSPLLALYRDLDEAIEALSPVCVLSGRCCRFREYGHTLFVSEPEARLLLADAPTPSRPLDDGSTCPWQDHSGRCSARDARPLGCRVYYCDPAYETPGAELSETFIARLKALVERLDLPWNYAPLHRHLEAARAESRYPGETLSNASLAAASSNPGERVLENPPATQSGRF